MNFYDRTETRVSTLVLDMIGLNDPYTKGHCIETANLAKEIAKHYGFTYEDQRHIYVAGLLHDVGKQAIPKEILSKPERLSAAEFNLVKTHVEIGVDLLKGVEFINRLSLRYIAEHHERIDGSGYPYGLKGDEISKGGQIIGVADVISALTSKRTYRTPHNDVEVIAILNTMKGHHFEAGIVEAAVAIYSKGLILPAEVADEFC